MIIGLRQLDLVINTLKYDMVGVASKIIEIKSLGNEETHKFILLILVGLGIRVRDQ